ncbi:MAG: 4'-phosphopantetheinyl transferase superfamily protein [Bacteroidaceae bacterium]|nr:4'-phosphopantetheinyl transferase superfamily protein [Bacteroidaceae bacterium]
MKLIVRDNLDGYLPEDLERDISQLPSWRREQALKYRHFQGQRDCTLSYLLLCQALEDEFGIADKPTFLIGEHGKPSLQEYPSIHFNISHCADAIACAVGDKPIGIDVESTERKISDALIRHTMSPQEQEKIAGDPIRFFRFWTQKEALVKLRGTGLQDNLHDLLLPQNTADIVFHTEEHADKGYVLSIATFKE